MKHPLITRLFPAPDRRVARQTLWMGAITAVQLLGGLAQVSISARILGPDGYGVLAVIVAVTLLIYGLLAIPGGEAVTAFVTRGVAEGRPEEASRILRFVLAISLGLSLIAYALIAALTFTASSLLGIDQAYRDAMLLYGLVGIFLATQTETLAVLRLSDRVSLGLAVTIASVLTRVALLAAAWLMEGGLLWVILAHVAGSAVNGVGMFLAAAVSAPRAGLRGLLRSGSLKVPSDVVRFQAGAFGKSTIWALTHNMDSILVAQFTGAADVGLYRGARQIIDTARYPFQPLMDGVQPEYSRQWYSRRGEALRRATLRFGLVSFTLAVVEFGMLVIFHQLVTRLILGAEFSGAAPLLLIMIPGSFVATSVSVLSGGGTCLAITGGGGGRLGGFRCCHPVAGAPVWPGGSGPWANTAYFIVFVVVLMPCVISILRQTRRREDEGREMLK